MSFPGFIELITPLVWPITLLLLCLMFIKPLYKAVSARASRLDTATIKIGGFEWTSSELDSVLVEREILKSAILMAAIDENFSEPEKLLLKTGPRAWWTGWDSLRPWKKKGPSRVNQHGCCRQDHQKGRVPSPQVTSRRVRNIGGGTQSTGD